MRYLRNLKTFLFGNQTERDAETIKSLSIGDKIRPIDFAKINIDINTNPFAGPKGFFIASPKIRNELLPNEDQNNTNLLTNIGSGGLLVDIWLMIIASLDADSIVALMSTCKTFYRLIYSNENILETLQTAKITREYVKSVLSSLTADRSLFRNNLWDDMYPPY